MYKPDFSSILSYLTGCSKAWPQKNAFVIRRRIRREITDYSDLVNWILQIEAWFGIENIIPESKILFWGLNCPEYALALLSCFSTNRTAVPIDWRNSVETILGVIEKTRPKFAFVSKYFRHDFLSDQNIKVYYIEDLFEAINKSGFKIKDIQQILNSKEYTNPENIVEIVFTSGTTGKPKGVIMKQKNLLANLKAVQSFLPDHNNPKTISILPLSHMLEQVAGLLLPLSRGTTIHYLPRINSFRLLQAFSEYQPTHLVFVPQLLKIFWEKIEDRANSNGQLEKLSFLLKISAYLPISMRKLIFSKVHNSFGGNLEFIACGGAPLDKRIGEIWMNLGIPVIEGYGTTEATAVSTINNFASPKLGTVGKPIPGVEIHLDKNGEIYIRGESLTSGYYEDPQKTNLAFTGDGYKTGDIGRFDNEGNLRIIGRDVFKIVLPSGEKVFVEDLETKILEDARVKEVCVVAKKLADGDKIHAFLILKKGVKDGLKTVIADVNSRLESKQQIASFDLWPGDDFPRTPTLKVDRKTVYEVANQQKAISEAVANKADGVYAFQNVVDIVAKISGIDKTRISDSDTLAGDLNIDSLSRVELVALTEEHLGLIIDETKITAKTTIAELKQLAKSADSFEEVVLPAWQFSKWGQRLHFLTAKYIFLPFHSVIIKIKYPQKVIGDIKAGSIIVTNHPGLLDIFCTVRLLFRKDLTRLVTPSWEDNWRPRDILTFALELFLGGLPFYESGHKFIKVMQCVSDLMDQGYILLFLPQGKLEAFDAKTEDPFLPGIGFIARELRKPIYIIKVKGYKKIWPNPPKDYKNSSFFELLPKRTGTVDVLVANQISIDYDNLTPIQITNLLEEKYKSL